MASTSRIGKRTRGLVNSSTFQVANMSIVVFENCFWFLDTKDQVSLLEVQKKALKVGYRIDWSVMEHEGWEERLREKLDGDGMILVFTLTETTLEWPTKVLWV
ncbi:hypothetical protein LINGRAHAP2_LOCUS23220, partial [Linum grandiflorum]